MHRTRHRLLVGVVTTLALALTGCGGDGGETADPAADATADEDAGTPDETAADDGETEQAEADEDAGDEEAGTDEQADDGATAATVAVASSELGDIVVDSEGRTLYMFVPDEGGEPTCTGDCAQTWPVLEGPATAGDGADEALLSTAEHPSGATQVTYGGWPLYYFANDAAPGDVNGQGVNDVWFVIGPDGEPIRDDAAASGGGVGY